MQPSRENLSTVPAGSVGPPSSPELHELLYALQAVRDGNFSVRLPGHWTELHGKIADTFNEITTANERMARVLAEKGYEYQFVFVKNATHCDDAVKRQTLPEALEWLWRGDEAKSE